MLNEFVKKSPVNLKDLANYLETASPSLCKILKCQFYTGNNEYDKMYDYLEDHNTIAPRRNGVVAYPSDKAHGSWDIWIDNKFVTTLVFSNKDDLLNFLNEADERLSTIKSLFMNNNGTEFNNRIALRGHTRK